jgi:hypothetical protein
MSEQLTWGDQSTARPSSPKGATYHPDLIQGSDEWRAVRCGLLTASEMKLIITPTLKIASNDKERAHLYELLAQRITKFVEPAYVSDDMLRGQEDEIMARALYHEHYHPVEGVGFVTNDKWGFLLGYSPDGLVGANGLIECKSRRQKFQVETMIECVPTHEVPTDYLIQHQTGLLVADDREWIDFISYSGGWPMIIIRVHPDHEVQDAIVNAAGAFERRLAEKHEKYKATASAMAFLPTERRVEEEIVL